ncbi:zinc-binding dehydrogenase [Tistrella bauzanensis]
MTKLHAFKPGGTLVVTGAAGAVGSTAAQLGKLRGLRVVGVAGGPAKVARLTDELGLDAAIDYKAADVEDQVRRALPDGIDAFFENVGGPIFPVLMEYFNTDAKMTLCGTIADYSETELPTGTNYLPRLITLIHYRFVSIKAFAIPMSWTASRNSWPRWRPWSVTAGSDMAKSSSTGSMPCPRH